MNLFIFCDYTAVVMPRTNNNFSGTASKQCYVNRGQNFYVEMNSFELWLLFSYQKFNFEIPNGISSQISIVKQLISMRSKAKQSNIITTVKSNYFTSPCVVPEWNSFIFASQLFILSQSMKSMPTFLFKNCTDAGCSGLRLRNILKWRKIIPV